MQIFVGPVDVVGNLWVIRPRGAPLHVLETGSLPRSRTELHVSRPSAIDNVLLGTIRSGRAAGLFERAVTFAARIERLAEALRVRELDTEWTWAEMSGGHLEHIDDERSALAWFLRHSAELLLVDAVAFERRHAKVVPPRVRPQLEMVASA